MPNITLCDNVDENAAVFVLLTQILSDYSLKGITDAYTLKCKLPCITEFIDTYTSVLLNTGGKYWRYFKKTVING